MLSITEDKPHRLMFPISNLEEDFYEIEDLSENNTQE